IPRRTDKLDPKRLQLRGEGVPQVINLAKLRMSLRRARQRGPRTAIGRDVHLAYGWNHGVRDGALTSAAGNRQRDTVPISRHLLGTGVMLVLPRYRIGLHALLANEHVRLGLGVNAFNPRASAWQPGHH